MEKATQMYMSGRICPCAAITIQKTNSYRSILKVKPEVPFDFLLNSTDTYADKTSVASEGSCDFADPKMAKPKDLLI
jgi:hypothetical protein